jgi:hypothetical protein
VGGGVGEHERGQAVGVLLGLGGEVGEVHVARSVAGDHHHAVAGHDGRGGVGAVRGGRDEADVALLLAAGVVVLANHEQPGIFAL